MPGDEAQLWFTDPVRRQVSTAFDDRETAPSRRLNAALTLALMPTARTVLDVGCGGGEMLAEIRALDPTLTLLGVDPVKDAIHHARQLHAADPRAEFLLGSAEALPALPHQPDVAVSHLNLGLWRDPLTGLTAVLRALTEGGCLFVVDVAAATTSDERARFLRLAQTAAERCYLADQNDAAHSPEELKALLGEALKRADRDGEVHVGRGGLAGYAYDSSEAAKLFSSPAVRSALAEFSGGGSSSADVVLSAVVRLR